MAGPVEAAVRLELAGDGSALAEAAYRLAQSVDEDGGAAAAHELRMTMGLLRPLASQPADGPDVVDELRARREHAAG